MRGPCPPSLIPCGLMTLVWGPLSDRIGRRRLILASMAASVILTAVTARGEQSAGSGGKVVDMRRRAVTME